MDIFILWLVMSANEKCILRAIVCAIDLCVSLEGSAHTLLYEYANKQIVKMFESRAGSH